jgi:hypothetical protein
MALPPLTIFWWLHDDTIGPRRQRFQNESHLERPGVWYGHHGHTIRRSKPARAPGRGAFDPAKWPEAATIGYLIKRALHMEIHCLKCAHYALRDPAQLGI